MDEVLHDGQGLVLPPLPKPRGRPPGSGRGSTLKGPMTTLSLKVPTELLRRIDRVCQLFGNDRANFLRRLIHTHLPAYEAQVADFSPPERSQSQAP